jgi:hypothetical protein
MRSGDRPGLQNRRVASSGVTGGFNPHSLPPSKTRMVTEDLFVYVLVYGLTSLQW